MLIKKLFSLTSINNKNLQDWIKFIIFEVGKQVKGLFTKVRQLK